MKFTAIIASLVLTVTLNAATQSQETAKVQVMLADIEKASAAKRYEKINAFKKEIKTMHQEVQTDANQKLVKLQERLRIQERINKGNGQGEQVQNRNEIRNEEKENLMLQEQQMQQLQRKDQMQVQQKIKKVEDAKRK